MSIFGPREAVDGGGPRRRFRLDSAHGSCLNMRTQLRSQPREQHCATHIVLCARAPAQQLAWLRQKARRCIRGQRRLLWEQHPACARAAALRPPGDYTGSAWLQSSLVPHPLRARLSPSSLRLCEARVGFWLVRWCVRMGEHTYGPLALYDGGCHSHIYAPTMDRPLANFGGRRVRRPPARPTSARWAQLDAGGFAGPRNS